MFGTRLKFYEIVNFPSQKIDREFATKWSKVWSKAQMDEVADRLPSYWNLSFHLKLSEPNLGAFGKDDGWFLGSKANDCSWSNEPK